MSTKVECLKKLDDIAQEHKKLLLALDILVRTADPEETKVQQNPSNCSYIQWFLSEEETTLKQRIGLQPMEKLELIHKEWHSTYNKIIEIFYPKKKSFFKKLIHTSPNMQELDKAKSYLFDLQNITHNLEETVTSIKRRINALSESKFR